MACSGRQARLFLITGHAAATPSSRPVPGRGKTSASSLEVGAGFASLDEEKSGSETHTLAGALSPPVRTNPYCAIDELKREARRMRIVYPYASPHHAYATGLRSWAAEPFSRRSGGIFRPRGSSPRFPPMAAYARRVPRRRPTRSAPPTPRSSSRLYAQMKADRERKAARRKELESKVAQWTFRGPRRPVKLREGSAPVFLPFTAPRLPSPAPGGSAGAPAVPASRRLARACAGLGPFETPSLCTLRLALSVRHRHFSLPCSCDVRSLASSHRLCTNHAMISSTHAQTSIHGTAGGARRDARSRKRLTVKD